MDEPSKFRPIDLGLLGNKDLHSAVPLVLQSNYEWIKAENKVKLKESLQAKVGVTAPDLRLIPEALEILKTREACGCACHLRTVPFGKVVFHVARDRPTGRVQARPLDGSVHARYLAVNQSSGMRRVRVTAAGHGGYWRCGGRRARVHHHQTPGEHHSSQLLPHLQLYGGTETRGPAADEVSVYCLYIMFFKIECKFYELGDKLKLKWPVHVIADYVYIYT